MKPVRWIGSSLADLKGFPKKVRVKLVSHCRLPRRVTSIRLRNRCEGSGAGVLEIFESRQGDEYRAVYTVRFAEAIYVLHCFKKKSKRGIKTPKHTIDLVEVRLQRAEEDYQQWLNEREA